LLLSERESKSLQEVSGGHGLVGAGMQGFSDAFANGRVERF